MLGHTKQLFHIFQNTAAKKDYSILRAYCQAIAKRGKTEDAQQLLDIFLQDPTDPYRASLLEPVKLLGNQSMAQELAEGCFENQLLRQGIHEDVLETIVWLEYEEAESLLIHQFQQEKQDYYHDQSTCIGLLHYACTSYQDIILTEIEKCYDQNLFREFVPALVCKLPQEKQAEVLDRLYEMGNTVVSTDCNAGIIVGFALSGEKGRKLFQKVFWNKQWETYGGGTGTDYWAYIALEYLGVSLKFLYDQIKYSVKTQREPEFIIHQLRVMKSMLRHKVGHTCPFKFLKPLNESYQEIFDYFFAWSTPEKDDSIAGLSRHFTHGELSFHEEERLLRMRMEQEILWQDVGI